MIWLIHYTDDNANVLIKSLIRKDRINSALLEVITSYNNYKSHIQSQIFKYKNDNLSKETLDMKNTLQLLRNNISTL